eukprot:4974710-Heterocapsa_arctica.AAC.1
MAALAPGLAASGTSGASTVVARSWRKESAHSTSEASHTSSPSSSASAAAMATSGSGWEAAAEEARARAARRKVACDMTGERWRELVVRKVICFLLARV